MARLSILSDAACPSCGEQPTEDSVVETRLSALGYHHEDVSLVCSECDNAWQLGTPLGTTDDERWVCDGCGGDLMPHFLYVYLDEETAKTKPKCQDCNWVPDEPIDVECSTAGDTARLFIGHHAVTGSQDGAEPNGL